MKRSLCRRLRMTVFSSSLLICVFAGFLLLIRFRIQNYIGYNLNIGSVSLKEMGTIFLDDIYMAHTRNGFSLFSPVLAVIPAATTFCDDYNSGFLKFILGREKKKQYIRETILCSTISGGLAIFLPCLLADIFLLADGKMNTKENMIQGYSTVFDETVYADIQYVWGGIGLAMLLLLLSFLFGALWSNIGLLVSAVVPNKYAALVMPFAIYFAVHLLLYKSDIFLVFSPANMLMPSATFIPYKEYPFVYQIALMGMVNLAYSRIMEGRLENV